MKKNSGMFYGWWLVLLVMLLGGLGGGVSLYIISLVAGAIEHEFEVNRVIIMLAVTGHNLMAGLLAPKISHLMDRLSVRKVLTFACLLAGLGYLLIAVTPVVWGFVGAYGILLPMFTICFTSLAPAILLSRWFVKRRGTAIGLATLGTQLGGFLFPPFVAMMFEVLGWRISMTCIGIGVMFVVPLLVNLFVVERPSDKGLYPDGDDDDPELKHPEPATEGQLDELISASIRSQKFWLVSCVLTVMMSISTAVLSNLALFAMDIGIERESAALMISLYSIVGLCSAFTMGRLCDRFDVRLLLAGSLFISFCSMLMFSMSSTFSMLCIATGMVAISGGGLMPLWTSLVGKLFDHRLYARMFGQVSRVVITCAALSPLLSGFLFDMTGSYRVMFLLFAAATVVVVLFIPLLKLHQPSTLSEPLR